jgi:hypothetical protein
MDAIQINLYGREVASAIVRENDPLTEGDYSVIPFRDDQASGRGKKLTPDEMQDIDESWFDAYDANNPKAPDHYITPCGYLKVTGVNEAGKLKFRLRVKRGGTGKIHEVSVNNLLYSDGHPIWNGTAPLPAKIKVASTTSTQLKIKGELRTRADGSPIMVQTCACGNRPGDLKADATPTPTGKSLLKTTPVAELRTIAGKEGIADPNKSTKADLQKALASIGYTFA